MIVCSKEKYKTCPFGKCSNCTYNFVNALMEQQREIQILRQTISQNFGDGKVIDTTSPTIIENGVLIEKINRGE